MRRLTHSTVLRGVFFAHPSYCFQNMNTYRYKPFSDSERLYWIDVILEKRVLFLHMLYHVSLPYVYDPYVFSFMYGVIKLLRS